MSLNKIYYYIIGQFRCQHLFFTKPFAYCHIYDKMYVLKYIKINTN